MSLSDSQQVRALQQAEALQRAAAVIDELAKTRAQAAPRSHAVTLQAVSMVLRQTSRELFVEIGNVLMKEDL